MTSNICNNQEAVDFVMTYKSDCMVIAKALKLPPEYVLGLAALESQYGKGRIAREYNNFFSMHAPAPHQTGAIAPLGNAKIKVAIYPSFRECALLCNTIWPNTHWIGDTRSVCKRTGAATL